MYSVAQKMTISNLLLLVLVLVLVFSTESMAEPGCAVNNAGMLWDQCPLHSHEGWASWWKPGVRPPPRAPGQFSPFSYDERLLVLQWPPTFCNTQGINCDHFYQKFTVHGLWFNIDSKPVCCPPSNAPIRIQRMPRRLWHSMVTHWPDLKCPEYPKNFWRHEYAKHGSCVTGFQNQEHYFSTALAILEEIGDVTTMRLRLSESPLIEKPLERGWHQVKEFEHVTIGGKRFFPSLRCVSIPNPQLLEIVFCTDIHNEQRPCPPNVQTCNSEWFLP